MFEFIYYFVFFPNTINCFELVVIIPISALSFGHIMKWLANIICFFCCVQFGAAQSAFECFSIGEGFQSHPFINEGTEVYFSLDKILIGDNDRSVEKRQKFFKEYRESIVTFFDCQYSFESLPHFGDMKVIHYEVENEESIYFIREDLLEKYYLIFQGFAFELHRCEHNLNDLCLDDYYYNPSFMQLRDSFRLTADTTEIYIEEAEFELVTEQVLTKDAFNILQVQDAQFDTLEQIILIEQKVICPDIEAEFETINDSIIKMDAFATLIAFPPSFEIATEQFLFKSAYSGYDTMSLELDLEEEELIVKEAYENWTWKIIDSTCIDASPNDCLFFDKASFDKESFLANSLNYTSACPDGYNQEGNLCYKVALVPAEYQSRNVLLLATPAHVMERLFEPAFHSFQTTLITNIDEIDTSCIEAVYDTIQYYKLVAPASVSSQEFSAQYSTIEHLILIDNLRISISHAPGQYEKYDRWKKVEHLDIRNNNSLCDPFLTEEVKDKILIRMRHLGLINDDVAFGSALFWNAVCHFQLDNEIPLGNIDNVFILKLGIQ